MNDDLLNILLHDLKIPTSRLTPDTSLDDACLDSLAFVELSVVLRERFGIHLSEDELKNTGTLGGLDLLVTQKRNEG